MDARPGPPGGVFPVQQAHSGLLLRRPDRGVDGNPAGRQGHTLSALQSGLQRRRAGRRRRQPAQPQRLPYRLPLGRSVPEGQHDGHSAKVYEPAGRQDPDLPPVSPAGRGAQAGGRCAAEGCRAALSHPAQRRVGQVQLHCMDGVPAGFPVQHREQAGVCQRHRGY